MKEKGILIRADYGHIALHLREIMEERDITRNQLAKRASEGSVGQLNRNIPAGLLSCPQYEHQNAGLLLGMAAGEGWRQNKPAPYFLLSFFCSLFSYLEILLFRKHLVDGWQNQEREERAGNETANHNRGKRTLDFGSIAMG